MIKDHVLYEHFITHIKDKLRNKRITEGESKLLQCSYRYFEDFLKRYEIDEKFKNDLNKIVKSHIREEKISIIMDEVDK